MKKSFLIAGFIVILFACAKEEDNQNEVIPPVPENANPSASGLSFSLEITHNGMEDQTTKAVKTGWENGDVVYVFFSTVAAPKYLKMSYDGNAWSSVEMVGANEGSIGLTESGTMTAVYLPFANDASVSSSEGGFAFSKVDYSYYLICEKQPYTINGNMVEGVLNMSVPEGFVQFFVTDTNAANGNTELSESHVTPKAITGVAANGTVMIDSKSNGAVVPGFVYGSGSEKGYLFSGELSSSARGVTTDYHFVLEIGGQTKMLDGTKTMYRGSAGNYTHRAIKLPSLNAWTSYVAVTGVTLDTDHLDFSYIGESRQLTATLVPGNATNQAVTWSSNNTSVATVSSTGRVTAKGSGTASITVTTDEGGRTATCSVSVVIPVSRVDIGWEENDNLVYSQEGNLSVLSINSGKPIYLTAYVSPSNATDKSITWSMSNTTTVQISNQTSTGCMVLGKNVNGSVTIYATASNGERGEIKVVMYKSRHPIPVDLGLASGTKWGSLNIENATDPQDNGYYYSWGSTTHTAPYSWDNYKYYEDGKMNKYCSDASPGYNGLVDNLTTLEAGDDLAYQILGGNWRIPTRQQWFELLNSSNLTWVWVTKGTGTTARKGWSVRSTNGSSIFLPAAGKISGSTVDGVDSYGYYWSSSLCTDDSMNAYYLYFSSGQKTINYYYQRYYGLSIRPVTE